MICLTILLVPILYYISIHYAYRPGWDIDIVLKNIEYIMTNNTDKIMHGYYSRYANNLFLTYIFLNILYTSSELIISLSIFSNTFFKFSSIFSFKLEILSLYVSSIFLRILFILTFTYCIYGAVSPVKSNTFSHTNTLSFISVVERFENINAPIPTFLATTAFSSSVSSFFSSNICFVLDIHSFIRSSTFTTFPKSCRHFTCWKTNHSIWYMFSSI